MIPPGGGINLADVKVLAGIAIVHWVQSFHYPPRTIEIFGGELFEEADVVWCVAVAGDWGERYALMLSHTLDEVDISLVSVAEGTDVAAILHMDLLCRVVLVPFI